MESKNKIRIQELLGTSLRVYFKNIPAWLLICFFVYLPLCMRDCMVMSHLLRGKSLDGEVGSSDFLDQVALLYRRYAGLTYWLRLGFVLLDALFVPLAIAAVSSVTLQSLSNSKVEPFQVLDNSLLKWKKLFLVSVVRKMLLCVPFYFVFPLVFYLLFYFCPVVIALSSSGVFCSMFVSRFSLVGHVVEASLLIIATRFFSLLTSAFFYVIWFVAAAGGGNFLSCGLFSSFLCHFVNIFFDIVLILWFMRVSSNKLDDVSKLFAKEFGGLRK